MGLNFVRCDARMDPQTLIDIAIGMVTLLGSAGSAVAAGWLFFRKRLQRWWQPYKEGLAGAAQVPELKDELSATRRDVDAMAKSLDQLTLQVRARGDTNIEQAEFETDSTGANTYVNLTYARWLGVGKAELRGWGWVNYVHPEDRIRVRQEWDACRTEHRVFNARYRFIDADGLEFMADVIATPIPEAPPARQWYGVIRKVVT